MEKDRAAAARTEEALVVATGAPRHADARPWIVLGRQGSGARGRPRLMPGVAICENTRWSGWADEF